MSAWRRHAGAWTLDDHTIRLADPLPPTRDLVGMVVSDYAWRIVLGTCADGADAWMLMDWLLDADDPLDPGVIGTVADELVRMWFGRPRWTVRRLWQEALGAWSEVDADLSIRGVDVLALPPDRATNAVYGTLRKWHPGDKLERWLRDLDEPPAPARTVAAGPMPAGGDAWTAAAAADWEAFAALAGKPVAPPATGVDSEIVVTD